MEPLNSGGRKLSSRRKDPCKVLQAGKSSTCLRKEEKENGAGLGGGRREQTMAGKWPVR